MSHSGKNLPVQRATQGALAERLGSKDEDKSEAALCFNCHVRLKNDAKIIFPGQVALAKRKRIILPFPAPAASGGEAKKAKICGKSCDHSSSQARVKHLGHNTNFPR